MINFRSGFLIAAKALAAKDWSNPKVILEARRMARAGASTVQIRDAIWPNVHVGTARRRLQKFNIHGRDIMDRAHSGEATHFPCEAKGISYRTYKPRSRASS